VRGGFAFESKASEL